MQHYFDNVQDQFGNAVGGVSVLVSLSSDGSRATVYSDNGINAKTNPLTTASNGSFDFYAANGKYTLTVTHPDGTTSDSYAELLDSSDVTAASTLSASTGSSLVGFIQDGTGAVATTVSAQLQSVIDANLKAWGYAQSFQLISATRDANSAVTSATIKWPDGSSGTFTADTVSTSFPGAVDAWHATYVGPPAKTVTQPLVTRDVNGAVTAQPAISVA